MVIPLRGLEPHPGQYGAIISGGWSDPRGTETALIKRKRVTVRKIFMDAHYDFGPDEWHVYVCINGRWRVWKDLSGDEQPLNFSVDLNLYSPLDHGTPADRIHITACGFEADLMHDHMGQASPFSWEQISDPNLTEDQRLGIIALITGYLGNTYEDENDEIGHFRQVHLPTELGSFTRGSQKGDYRIEYSIADL